MQSVNWIGFGSCSSISRTLVHFFPSGGGVTAPYPCTVKLSIFGPEVQELVSQRELSLEGARLSQPDGLRLDQAFPKLAEGVSGFFGLSIDLETTQPRIDLSYSSCIIELWSKGSSVRYWPLLVAVDDNERSSARMTAGVALSDVYTSTSLVCINKAGTAWEPRIRTLAGDCAVPEIPAMSVREFRVDDAWFPSDAKRDCSWGMLRSCGIEAELTLPGRLCYLMFRDCDTKRPISVSAL